MSQSFDQAGIPCGNPRRFDSNEVTKMTPGVKSRKRIIIDGPVEDIETEGERHLQTLAKKQLVTDITLKQQFSQHREFRGTSAFKPSVDSLVGVVDLSQYRQFNDIDMKVEELSRFGLTTDEIELKLKYDTGQLQKSNFVGFGVNPDVEKWKLQTIEEKIAQTRSADDIPVKFANVQQITRHEMDLEKSICSSNSQDQKLSQFLVVQKDYEKTNPLSMVPDIMSEIDDNMKRRIREKRQERKRLKKAARSKTKYQLEENECVSEDSIYKQELSGNTDNFESENDSDGEFIGPLLKCESDARVPKIITKRIEPISEKDIRDNRLDISEIIKIRKFENYTKGESNQTLYLKNIHAKATDEDLIAIFGRFEIDCEQNIIYKLMSGRMRGQAFVTFPSVKVATEALELVNGYILKDKPLIVQFGKSSIK